MKKVTGVFLLILSVFLFLWCLLSLFGYASNFSDKMSGETYPMWKMIAQPIVYLLFGLMGFRAFKAGKSKLLNI